MTDTPGVATTTVVHFRDRQPGDEYIGRQNHWLKLEGSPYRNGFAVKKIRHRLGCSDDEARRQAVRDFEAWVRTSDAPRAVWIREHVHELKGKRLVCWCAPKPCHGDVLACMADGGASSTEPTA